VLTVSLFLCAPFALANPVVLILQDSHDSLSNTNVDALQDFYSELMPKNQNVMLSGKPKFVHISLDNFSSPETIINQLQPKISVQDTIFSIVLIAHGGPTHISLDSKIYSGAQVGDVMAKIVNAFNRSTKLNFYFWSCKAGCRIGTTSSFQEDFAVFFVKQLDKNAIALERLDVLSHMSITNGNGKMFQRGSLFNHLLLNSHFIHALAKVIATGTSSQQVRAFFQKHKTVNTILFGDQFTPPMAIPSIAIGVTSFMTGLALLESQPTIASALLAGSTFVATAAPFILKKASQSLRNYVKRLSITTDSSVESYGYLAEMLQETINAKRISCKEALE
jgi:hypothetical protein